ncbi:glycosyltransferase [Mycobacterium sp. 1274761.0]|uniref:glycosyltransferase n=1 Tax=Mycobacterium sp. 1274761.0 TaxID=1834077 RepID=UPI0007FF8BB1|nr:glycosyltransferase [Mycobacterium sp. 1274761.0]OBK76893.1 glycosyl transferase [Mycobacterium sp. 1274761.0]
MTERAALTEHAAPERLVVARGLFTGPSASVPDEMYARIIGGKAHRERNALHLEHGATVDTNTYFGRLPASYFQRWTTATEVALKLTFDADGPATLLLRASDAGGTERTVASREVDGTGTAELTARLNEFVDGGALWMESRAVGGPLKITDLEWTVPGPEKIRPAAIAICTFNRADDCATNLATIAGDKSLLAGIDAVYVADQGTDAVETRQLYQDAAAQLGDKLVYLRQPNLGGAGGFARGLYEISSIADHANVILMDDDILLDPETVLRLNAFANLTPHPTIIGAQMLYLKNTKQLHVGAEQTEMPRLRAGRWAPNALHNANMLKYKQDQRVDAEYNAWWSCLIPSEVIAAIGLPLPMFFQWDDIEYGLRAAESGFPTTTLPNAGVWHADFHWKDRDEFIRYFSVRNALITHAMHGRIDPKTTSRWLGREIAECLSAMQYGLAYTMVRGIEDFLEGPRVLHDGGPEALAAIRKERAEFPETVVHPAVKISELTGTAPRIVPIGHRPRKDRINLVLAKRVVYQWLGRAIPGPVAITAAHNEWWHVSLFDSAVVTDASQSGVRLRRRDKQQLKRVSRRAAKALRRLQKEAPAAQATWREALPTLTNRENWGRLFNS